MHKTSSDKEYGIWLAGLAAAFAVGCAASPERDEAVQADQTQEVKDPTRCIAPWGIDWNNALGVQQAAVVSFFCNDVQVGEPYVPVVLWITNTEDGVEGKPVVYPPDYKPRDAAPMRDFLDKVELIRYVVQPGNLEFIFPEAVIGKAVVVGDLFAGSDEFPEPEMAQPATAMLGELPAMPPGTYSADIHFVMSDTHCDGNTTDFASSCLVPGDNFTLTRHFIVHP